MRHQQHSFRHSRGEFGREELRHYGQQSQRSNARIVDPYGGLGVRQARQSARGFADPLAAIFGFAPEFGNGPRGQRREARFDRRLEAFQQGNSPLAQYANQAANFLPTMLGQAQNAGSQIASLAPQVFDQLRGQINNALASVPGMQANAQRMVDQSQSPIASQALYQDAMRNALEGSRGAAAGRGLLDAGAAQQGEQELGRDLASQFAARRFGEQQSALQTQAGLLPMGVQLAQQLGPAAQQLAALSQAGYQIPMDALQQVFQQFAAFQNPRLALAQLAQPQVATESRGSGFNIL